MDIDALRQELREASSARAKIKSESDEWERRERQEFLTKMQREQEAIFGENLRAAQQRENEALWRLEKSREEEALTAEYTYPLGTVLLEWTQHRWSNERQFTGKRGILEVITEASAHPDNLSRWSCADRGEVVIRVLKKDGTPSKRYVTGWNMTNLWVPEGTDLSTPDLSWKLKKEPETSEVGQEDEP